MERASESEREREKSEKYRLTWERLNIFSRVINPSEA
jgi:hypothetical protein